MSKIPESLIRYEFSIQITVDAAKDTPIDSVEYYENLIFKFLVDTFASERTVDIGIKPNIVPLHFEPCEKHKTDQIFNNVGYI